MVSRPAFLGFAFSIVALLISSSNLYAGKITVRQGGGGDYTSVDAAITASAPGDTIEIGPGVYQEPSMVAAHSLVFESTDGAAATVLDGQDAIRILRLVSATFDVSGLTFTHGNNPNFGAIGVVTGANVTVRDCIFENNTNAALAAASGSDCSFENCQFVNNTSVQAPGGVYASAADVSFVGCEFVGNQTEFRGGAVSAVIGADITITDCTFRDNTAGNEGGAVYIQEAGEIDVSGNLFENNTGDGSAIYTDDGFGSIANNTFYANVDGGGVGGTIHAYSSNGLTVTKNIIALQADAPGLRISSGAVTHTCNIYWSNSGGPIDGDALDASELLIDPVFCDAAGGDFTVSSLGPAAAANSPCGQLVGAFPVGCAIEPPPPPSNCPLIVDISDVPNDEGREVRIKWCRSAQDEAGTEHTITGYAIYRHQDMIGGVAAAQLSPPPATGRGKGAQVAGWDYLVTAPARGDSLYQTVVTTLCDSTEAGMCTNAFFVSAMTLDPLVFFDSEPDTGYSVDNLPPAPPAMLVVSFGATGARIEWDAAEEPDVDRYRVYRGAVADFAIAQSNRVAETEEPNWVDAAGASSDYYKVTSVDEAGNESIASPAQSSAGGAPRAFSLGQNVPNPFNPTTVIPYSVGPGGGQVTLRVYDVKGRLVVTLVDEFQTTGLRVAEWTGHNDRGEAVASGTYFYRLTAPGFEKTLKMTLIQ